VVLHDPRAQRLLAARIAAALMDFPHGEHGESRTAAANAASSVTTTIAERMRRNEQIVPAWLEGPIVGCNVLPADRLRCAPRTRASRTHKEGQIMRRSVALVIVAIVIGSACVSAVSASAPPSPRFCGSLRVPGGASLPIVVLRGNVGCQTAKGLITQDLIHGNQRPSGWFCADDTGARLAIGKVEHCRFPSGTGRSRKFVDELRQATVRQRCEAMCSSPPRFAADYGILSARQTPLTAM
jgi:hypothetical protein